MGELRGQAIIQRIPSNKNPNQQLGVISLPEIQTVTPKFNPVGGGSASNRRKDPEVNII